MEKYSVEQLKSEYCKLIIANGEYDRALEIVNGPVYSPLLKLRDAHPDSEPEIKDCNNMIQEIINDIAIVNIGLGTTASSVKSLIEGVNGRIKTVKKNIMIEKDRLQDINMLCNDYSDFGSVIPLTADNFVGEFSESEGVISAKIINEQKTVIAISSIEGNGYEGNKYVYKDDVFLIETINTSNRSYLIDNSKITQYEYSRITASNTEKDIFSEANFDSNEANCILILSSQVDFNCVKIDFASTDTQLLSVQTSDDGAYFREVVKRTINLNDAEDKYDITNYIPGSGIIMFPSTKYVKIALQSNGYTDDIIAFTKSS
jgi:hypothetical protein